jgi:hypothetical protein
MFNIKIPTGIAMIYSDILDIKEKGLKPQPRVTKCTFYLKSYY